MTKQVTLENTLSGGLGLPGGQVIPGKGSITVEPEIWASAKAHPVVAARVADGTIVVDGRGRKGADTGDDRDDRDENGDTPDMAELRRMFDASYERQGNALAVSQTEVTTLTGKVADLEAVVKTKDDEIAMLKAGSAGNGGAVTSEAKHRGAGSYSVMEGETELREKLTKDQAEAFNALDGAGKTKWLADNPKPAA